MKDENFLKSILSFLSDPATGNISHTRIGSIVAQVLAMVIVTHGYYTGQVPLIYVLATAGAITFNTSIGKIASFWKAHKADALKWEKELQSLRTEASKQYLIMENALRKQGIQFPSTGVGAMVNQAEKMVEPLKEDLKKYTGPNVPAEPVPTETAVKS